MQVYFYANLAFLLFFIFLQAQQDPTSSNTPPNAPPSVPSVSLFYEYLFYEYDLCRSKKRFFERASFKRGNANILDQIIGVHSDLNWEYSTTIKKVCLQYYHKG